MGVEGTEQLALRLGYAWENERSQPSELLILAECHRAETDGR